MRRLLRLTAFIAIVSPLLSTAPASLAHHGYSRFDGSKPLFFEGEITNIFWGQPHVEITMRAHGGAPPADLATLSIPEGGTVPQGLRASQTGEWEILASTIGRLERRGVRQTDFTPGKRIRAIAYPSCDEQRHARAELLILDDGRLFWIRDAQAQTVCEAPA